MVAIVAALAVAFTLANVAWWLDVDVLDVRHFLAASEEAMQEMETRDAAAEMIVDRLIEEFPIIKVLETALVSNISNVLAEDRLQPVIASTARHVHDRLVDGGQGGLVVDFSADRDLFLAPLAALSPELADRVPEDWFTAVEVFEPGTLPDLSVYDKLAGRVSYVAALIAAGLVAIILLAARRWFSALLAVGLALVLAGGFSALTIPVVRIAVGRFIQDPPSSVLIRRGFDVFSQPLWTRSEVMLAVGAILTVGGLAGYLIGSERAPAPGRARVI